MANTVVKVKRTTVSGRVANTTDVSNSSYISAGEFALNMADGILYSSDGSNLIPIGANNVNINVTNTISIGNSTTNVTINSTYGVFAGNSTVNTNITSTQIETDTGQFQIAAYVGSNVSILTDRLFIGNASTNAVITQTSLALANDGYSANLKITGLSVGNTTINAVHNQTYFDVSNSTYNSNLSISGLSIGNSTGNTVITSALVSANDLYLLPQNTSIVTPANTSEGSVFYDSVNHALNFYTDTATPQEINQQIFIRAVNKTGASIPSNSVVYLSGAQGGRATVNLAIANSASTHDVIGLAFDTIANNAEGFVLTYGLFQGANTSAFSTGDDLYLSTTTPGTFTNIKPSYPNYAHQVGIALNATNNGKILVNPAIAYNSGQPNTSLIFSDGYRLISNTALVYNYANNILTTTGNVVANNLTTTYDLTVGRNLVVSGNLTVNGGVTSIIGNNITVSDNMLYLSQGLSANITNIVGNGTVIVFTANNNYQAGWDALVSDVNPSSYNGDYTITSANSTAFLVSNTNSASYVGGGTVIGKTTANPDIGIAAGYNDGTYHHTGIFRDASDAYWKVFDNYEPEPDTSVFIDTSNNTFKIANFWANSLNIGNTSVYAVANSTVYTGTANYVKIGNNQLFSNASGLFIDQSKIDHNSLTNYVTNQHTDHSTVNITAGNGLSGGGDITTTRTLAVNPNTGIISNTYGVFVNAAYINTISSNNASYAFGKSESALNVNSAVNANNTTYLNSQTASYYTNATNITTGTLPYAQLGANVVNTSSAFTLTGNLTLSGNNSLTGTVLTLANTLVINAQGSNGTSNQVLTSNGTAVYWSTVAAGGAGVNTAAQYSWTNTQTFSSNITVNAATLIVANSTTNTALPLPNTIQWNSTSYFLAANGSWQQVNTATRVYAKFTATASQTTFNVSGGYANDYIDVYYNGVHLGTDEYTQDGNNVVLTAPATSGAQLEVVGFKGIQQTALVVNTAYPYIWTNVITFSGNLNVTGTNNYFSNTIYVAANTTVNTTAVQANNLVAYGGVIRAGSDASNTVISNSSVTTGATAQRAFNLIGTDAVLKVVRTNSGSPAYEMQQISAAGVVESYFDLFLASNTFNIRDRNAGGGLTRLYIDASGNTGIGNTTPTDKLSVQGTTYLGGNVYANASLLVANTLATTMTTGATAAGTNQGTAYAITASGVQFTTVASGTGAILPSVPAGVRIFIANDGANSLLLYPATNGIIDQTTTNNPITVISGGMWEGVSLGSNNWTSIAPDSQAGNGMTITQGNGQVTFAVNPGNTQLISNTTGVWINAGAVYAWTANHSFAANVTHSNNIFVTSNGYLSIASGNATVNSFGNVFSNSLLLSFTTGSVNSYTNVVSGTITLTSNVTAPNTATLTTSSLSLGNATITTVINSSALYINTINATSNGVTLVNNLLTIGNSTINATMNSTSYTGTAANATLFNNNLPSYYTNATNINAGILSLSYGGTGKTSAPSALGNLLGYTTTTMANGNTALTNTSSAYQFFTGGLSQTVTLPDVTTLAQGWTFYIINNGTVNITVNTSGGNTLGTVIPSTTAIVTCVLTSGTGTASWNFEVNGFSSVTGTGSAVLATNPTIANPTISTIINTGTLTLPTSTDTLVGRATTDTLTNKRVTPRVSNTASITSPLALNSDNFDQYNATAQSTAFTVSADAGTPTDGQKIILRVKDNGSARIITFTGGVTKGYRPIGITLTASGSDFTYTTTASKTVYFGAVYNGTDSRWDIIAVSQEA